MYTYDGDINPIFILVLYTLVYFNASFLHMFDRHMFLVRLDLIVVISLTLADTLEYRTFGR